jgi:hypothetical protein
MSSIETTPRCSRSKARSVQQLITGMRWAAVLPASLLSAYGLVLAGAFALSSQTTFGLVSGLVIECLAAPFTLVFVARTIAPDLKVITGLAMASFVALGLSTLTTLRSANVLLDTLALVPTAVAAAAAFLKVGPKAVRSNPLPSLAGWLLCLPLAVCGALLAAVLVQVVFAGTFGNPGFTTDLETRYLCVLVFIAILGAVIPALKSEVVSTLASVVAFFGVFLVASGLAGMHVIGQFPHSTTLDSEAKNVEPITVVIQGIASIVSAVFPVIVLKSRSSFPSATLTESNPSGV